MNKPKVILIGLAGLLGLAVLTMVLRPVPSPSLVAKMPVKVATGPVARPAEPIVTSQSPIQEPAPTVKELVQSSSPVEVANDSQSNATPKATRKKSGPPKTKEPIQDLDARAALSLVGADPDAEQYWVAAINDPSLSPEERKDLIEDLNEDGLSDPKHPTEIDLPLILNRLELIESLAPTAMDQVNYDAFQEAYKDLTDMLAGKPVK